MGQRPEGNPARDVPYGAQEAAKCVQADKGVGQREPPPTGPGFRFRSEQTAAGTLQRLWVARNSRSLYRFYQWAIEWSFKWLNRRGGKRKRFTWKAFNEALKRLGVARPRITEPKRQHGVFA
ncbi:MAG: hypothetical protein ACFCVA_15215 [Gammaproteobacteria bacterium]